MFLGEMADSRASAGNAQDEPGTFCDTRKSVNSQKMMVQEPP